MSPTALPSLDLGIPSSTSSVSVSIIDTTTRINGMKMSHFVVPEITGVKYLIANAYSFLIQHPKLDRNLVFDLGIRKDQENLNPFLRDQIKNVWGAEITVEKDVREILEEGGVDAKKIEAVIWSHWHFDHVGDPNRFEAQTALIVGPGFKEKVAPGWPANPKSTFSETDYEGRELCEISFEGAGVGMIGQFRSFDYFGDGSFYLLDTPGHAIGHLAGLARVTTNPDSFVFMAGDACHHGGELRPSPYLPLPPNISPNPFTSLTASSALCPGALFEKLLPGGDFTRTFMEPTPTGANFDAEAARERIEKIQKADCRDNVLVVMAHDPNLEGIVDFFPKLANGFMEKGWVAKLRWLFLRDFAKAVGYDGTVEGRGAAFDKWNGDDKAQ